MAELKQFLSSWIADLRRQRNYASLLDAEATSVIASEIAERDQAITRKAHQAETCDLEAARLLARAQDPTSPGGRAITPSEAVPIARLINRSANIDHDLGEQLA